MFQTAKVTFRVTQRYLYCCHSIGHRRNTLWTDGQMYVRTYVRTDGHLRPALLGRLCPKMETRDPVEFRAICNHCVVMAA